MNAAAHRKTGRHMMQGRITLQNNEAGFGTDHTTRLNQSKELKLCFGQ